MALDSFKFFFLSLLLFLEVCLTLSKPTSPTKSFPSKTFQTSPKPSNSSLTSPKSHKIPRTSFLSPPKPFQLLPSFQRKFFLTHYFSEEKNNNNNNNKRSSTRTGTHRHAQARTGTHRHAQARTGTHRHTQAHTHLRAGARSVTLMAKTMAVQTNCFC